VKQRDWPLAIAAPKKMKENKFYFSEKFANFNAFYQ